MEKQKKRILNYRPMCIAALALIGGILLGEAFYGVHFFFRLIPLFFILALFVVLAVLKKTRRFAYICVAIIIGFLGICGSSDIYNKNTAIGEFEGEIYGKVSSEIIVDGEETRFFIEDVYAGETRLEYDAYVIYYAETDPDYNAGDIIRLNGKLVSNKHTRFDSFHAYDVAKREGYMVYVYSPVEKLAEGKLHGLEQIPYAIKKNFYERLDGDSAAICTALVLGDKEGLEEDLYDDISASGLAHVLAVSGLHISILSAAIFFVLRKCKVNSKISLLVVFLFSLLYCFICNFTASSLRALIMMTVLNFSIAFGKKRDSISSISFAAILILLFRPTALFEAGFLMSFAAVIGIVLFYGKFLAAFMKVVNKVSPKRHIGTRLAKGVALSLSANIVSYPFVAYFFNRVPILFVISNLVVLPYLMFIYIFLLINTLFALIVGWSGTLVIFKYLLFPFKAYVAAIGSLSFATVPVAISVIGIVAFLAVCVLFSRFLFIQRAKKVAIALSICAFTIVLSLIIAYGAKQNSSTVSEDVVSLETLTFEQESEHVLLLD